MHGPCILNTQVGLLKRPQEGFTSVHQGVGLAACLLAGSLGTGTTGYVARQDALRNDEFSNRRRHSAAGISFTRLKLLLNI